MKASYKMRMTIKRLEKKFGPFELEFQKVIYPASPVLRGFYSTCRCHNSSKLGNRYLIVVHDGSFGFFTYSLAELLKDL